MKKLIHFLHQHPLLHSMILLTYCLCVILPHEEVGLFIMRFLEKRPRAEMSMIVLSILGGVIALFSIPFFIHLKKHPQRIYILLYLSITLILVTVTYLSLFVLPTETAHFPQYALMAILIFPFTYRMDESLIWATLIGAMDEAYQYFYLAPERTDYFDFNDVVTNLLGAALGLIYLWAFLPKGIKYARRFTQSPAWAALGIWTLVVLMLHFWGDHIGLLLVREAPIAFWSSLKNGVTYHVLRPLPALGLICGLIYLYSGLGGKS